MNNIIGATFLGIFVAAMLIITAKLENINEKLLKIDTRLEAIIENVST